MIPVITGSLSRLELPIAKWCPHDRLYVLVEPHQFGDYVAAHPGVHIGVLQESGRGFGYMLNCAQQIAREWDEEHWMFCDDDVTGLYWRDRVGDKFVRRDPLEALDRIDTRVRALSVSVAQMAISFAGQSWGATKPWIEPTGAWGCLVNRTDAVHHVGGYSEKLPLFNDWELSARLVASGYQVGRWNLVGFEHTMKSHEGGAADIYRNVSLVNDTAMLLNRRWSAASRLVEAHGQLEVRFDWRRIKASASLRPLPPDQAPSVLAVRNRR